MKHLESALSKVGQLKTLPGSTYEIPQWKEVDLPNEQIKATSQEEGYEEISPCLF
jgi:hypothetical protein